jgi:hypothetical protein
MSQSFYPVANSLPPHHSHAEAQTLTPELRPDVDHHPELTVDATPIPIGQDRSPDPVLLGEADRDPFLPAQDLRQEGVVVDAIARDAMGRGGEVRVTVATAAGVEAGVGTEEIEDDDNEFGFSGAMAYWEIPGSWSRMYKKC